MEIAEPGRFLHKKRGFLVVQSAGTELGRIPLDDILAVIASAPGTSFSAGLIAALAETPGLSSSEHAICRRLFGKMHTPRFSNAGLSPPGFDPL